MFKSIKASRAEKIPAVGCEPWCPRVCVYILDRDQAKRATAPEPRTLDIYTDGSVRNGRAGIGIWTPRPEVSMIVGREEETNVHLTELLAIWLVIKDLSHELSRATRMKVFTDSQGALSSI